VGKRKKGGGETGERGGGGVLERGARAGSLFVSQRHNSLLRSFLPPPRLSIFAITLRDSIKIFTNILYLYYGCSYVAVWRRDEYWAKARRAFRLWDPGAEDSCVTRGLGDLTTHESAVTQYPGLSRGDHPYSL